jgi:hypothetical protein
VITLNSFVLEVLPKKKKKRESECRYHWVIVPLDACSVVLVEVVCIPPAGILEECAEPDDHRISTQAAAVDAA